MMRVRLLTLLASMLAFGLVSGPTFAQATDRSLGLYLNAKSSSTQPDLFRAIRGNNYERVKEELGKGEGLDSKEVTFFDNGKPKRWILPIHLAAELGHVGLLELMFEKGANANIKDSLGYTPLHYAAQKGRLEACQYLLEKGANINAFSTTGATALHLAAYLGQVPVMKLLLEKGANAKARTLDGDTPLHAAARLFCAECASLLIKAGASVSATDSWERTPLHYAAYNGDIIITRMLVEESARVDAPDRFGYTPLHTAAVKRRNPNNNQEEVCRFLLQRGAEPNAPDTWGYTPLHTAVRWERFPIISTMLEFGANPRVLNNEGRSPLDIAPNEEIRTLLRNPVRRRRG